MSKKLSRIFSVLFSVILCFSFIPKRADASELFKGWYLYWGNNNNGALTVYWYDYSVASQNSSLGAQLSAAQNMWNSSSFENCSLRNVRLSSNTSCNGKIVHSIPTQWWWDNNTPSTWYGTVFGYTNVFDTNGDQITASTVYTSTRQIRTANIYYKPSSTAYINKDTNRPFTLLNYNCCYATE